MKKTLIALALAATAVSGSAMAWVPSSIGDTMEFGGTLTPQSVKNPWEVQVGPNMNLLNSSIKLGGNKVDVTLSQSVPLLGIRTVESKAFFGAPGISPQIDYTGAVGIDNFNAGETNLSLKVFKADDATVEVGVLSATLSAAGEFAWSEGASTEKANIKAPVAGNGFFGGISKTDAGASANPVELVRGINPAFVANYDDIGATTKSKSALEFIPDSPTRKYSAFYGAGLKNGSKLTITLTKPAAENTNWKASFPITVSYQ